MCGFTECHMRAEKKGASLLRTFPLFKLEWTLRAEEEKHRKLSELIVNNPALLIQQIKIYIYVYIFINSENIQKVSIQIYNKYVLSFIK